ncbi:MAG TPA: GntR family transcriptional regulator, partial [Candidatus Didemnitutus sp.]|nr:GntR family transcriptional regulator [Candidatus Didemnitutus sp.]
MVSSTHGAPPARHRTKNEFVHDLLRGEILSLALKPGADLNIDEIARRLGVSAIPVREAVARLASERFVVMRPHIGAQVVPIDENSVHDIFALLEGLESAAAPRIASLATETDVNDLSRLLDDMDRPALRSDLIKWGAANTA